MQPDFKVVTKSIYKKDAPALLTGKPVYTEDLAPAECLIVKALRSPYPHAIIEDINVDKAKLVPGIEAVFTWKDVPRVRFTMAGQTYPEMSAYDQYILEERVRYVGDEVALVAGVDEVSVNKALKMIKVKYKVLPAIMNPEEALDNPILIHPEEDWTQVDFSNGDNKRNLAGGDHFEYGDVDQVMAESDVVVEGTFRTQACNQGMMENFATYCTMDPYGRLEIVSSTQIPFHVRRIVARALDIPKSKIRVIKPRIGGGFGAKQTACTECMTAFVTWKTGKPAKMVYSRTETLTTSNSRHEMIIRAKMGATKDGRLQAIDMYALSNQGAYGEHGPTTIGLVYQKGMTLYHPMKAYRFHGDVVYTNTMRAGAYRGYGATQGIFALESLLDDLADKVGMDSAAIRELNMVRQGDVMPSYHNATMRSCNLDKCLAQAKEMIGYDERPHVWQTEDGHVHAFGIGMSCQGSGIENVDQGSADIRLNSEGFYNLLVGSSDMGTGSDTTLAQIAAETLMCEADQVVTHSADTDISPYDSGSYASSTAFVTGTAVLEAAQLLIEKMKKAASRFLECSENMVDFDGKVFTNMENKKTLTLEELAVNAHGGFTEALTASATTTKTTSPPPFLALICEIDVDMETGKVVPVETAAVVDCGTPLNERIVKVQTEGGVIQGLGMALYEKVQYRADGGMYNNNLMTYKMPARTDIGNLKVEISRSYEPSGPYGAKSIGEVVINATSPAIANAVFHATGVRVTELPITPEKVYMGMVKNGKIKP